MSKTRTVYTSKYDYAVKLSIHRVDNISLVLDNNYSVSLR